MITIMEYTVHQLAQLAGVTVRTLHHYDQIGILCPQKRQENGYRLYGEDEVDILQQILLYREIGFTLQQIKEIMNDPDYSRAEVLSEQLDALIHKRNRLEQTIATVQRTLRMMEREEILSDEDKFIGLKHSIVEMNEKAFGRELRTRFGDEIIDGANQKMVSLNTGEWNDLSVLEGRIFDLLAKAYHEGDYKSEIAMEACELHKKWICLQWKKGTYSPEMHMALVEGYTDDERFRAYYDRIGEGCTLFLRDAMKYFLFSK